MPTSITPPTTRPAMAACLWLAVAAVLFVLYPVARPYADETTLEGAAAMASTAWVAAHTAGMVAFAATAAGIARLVSDIPGRPGRIAAFAAWTGTLLVLPYYGAETFGLQAIGARAVATADPSFVEVVETVRYGPVATATFGLGLLVLAVAGGALAAALRTAPPVGRWGGVITATGFALYLPQFFATPALRIAHGVVLSVGLSLLAVHATAGHRRATDSRPTEVSAHDLSGADRRPGAP